MASGVISKTVQLFSNYHQKLKRNAISWALRHPLPFESGCPQKVGPRLCPRTFLSPGPQTLGARLHL